MLAPWACVLGVLLSSSGNADSPPNILLLVAEDMSPRLAAYGDQVAQTPNLDRLAEQSVIYTNVFTTAGVCAPSRAALMTGQHQISFAAQHMRTSTGPLGAYLARPAAQVRAFPELLRAKGYYTFTDRKLDYQFSGIGAGSGPFTIWDQDNAADTAWRQRRAPGQPFFGMINFLETHESGVMRDSGPSYGPVHDATRKMRRAAGLVAPSVTAAEDVVLPPYYPDLPEVRADLARHYDNIHLMDKRVGRILQALADDRLLHNTVVIWTTDHGDGLPRAKRELFHAGVHVPLLMQLPAKVRAAQNLTDQAAPGHSNPRLVSFVDLAPTILQLVGVAPPGYLHGHSLLAGTRNYVYAARDRIDEVMDRQRMIFDGRYKYIRSWYPHLPGGHTLAYRDNLDMVRTMRSHFLAGTLAATAQQWFQAPGPEQLYDLQEDPFEINNLLGHGAAVQPELQNIRQQLADTLNRFLIHIGDSGTIPENTLRASLLHEGDIPTTAAPSFKTQHEYVSLHHPMHASMGYRVKGDTAWQLYTVPIPRPPAGTQLEARAVRYGWHASTVVSYVQPE